MDELVAFPEARQIRRYPEALSALIRRGSQSVCYSVGRYQEHLVYYPFIQKEQLYAYIKDGSLLDFPLDSYLGGQTSPYKSLEWIDKCFHIFDSNDTVLQNDAFVLVWEKQAALVSFRFGFDVGNNDTPLHLIQVQERYLNYILTSWQGFYFSGNCPCYDFYPLILQDGGISFFCRSNGEWGYLPFDLLRRFISKHEDWTESGLFSSFCLTQLTKKSDYDIVTFLDKLKHSFVHPRTYMGIARELLEHEWCYHTKFIISNASVDTEEERIVQKTIIKHCNGYLQDTGKNDVVEDTEPIQHYTSLNYEDDELLTMCHILKKDGYIDSTTKDEDFIYCMTGRGQRPVQRLVWKKTQTLLCIFVKMLMMEEESTIWNKTAQIFAHKKASNRLKGDSLRNNYARAKMYDAFKRNERQIQNLLTDFL